MANGAIADSTTNIGHPSGRDWRSLRICMREVPKKAEGIVYTLQLLCLAKKRHRERNPTPLRFCYSATPPLVRRMNFSSDKPQLGSD
jgi:hypothetical protein